jgi:hypothetical protein
MTNLKYIFSFALFIGSSALLSAQCPSPSELVKPDKKSGWNENSQSKSGALLAGEVYEYTFIAQRGVEYRITALGGVNEVIMDNVEFKLYDSEVQKVEIDGQPVYKRVQKVVYNSESGETGSQLVFTTPKTKKLTMKVNIVNSDKPDAVQCVAVYVETRRATQIGLK